MSEFKDHFSTGSAAYNAHRPGYPAALFDYLATLCPERKLAWDCATGTGQSALSLSTRFEQVIATDASPTQIEQAVSRDNIDYRVAPAERTDIADSSLDLITVAQALHWFDLDGFQLECRRVLKPGGILSAFTYNLLTIEAAIDQIVNHLYQDVVGSYWPPERTLVETGYAAIDFPLEEISTPAFAMEAQWNLSNLVGYLGTWSAVKRYIGHRPENPVAALIPALEDAWGDPENTRLVQWPLSVRVWRKP
ncbi:MAG: class I SAM-dependent methyltransferase [bacterium]